MHPLQQQQLKLYYNKNYNVNKTSFINVDQIKRANQYRSKYDSSLTPNRLLNHMIRNRKQQYEGHSDQFIHYQQLQKRINYFVSQNQKNDHTTIQLIYESIDCDKDGMISQQDFLTFLRSIGSTMSQFEVNQLFQLMTVQGTHLSKKEVQMIIEKGF